MPSYTIVGTPFSTFTRSITLGLQHKDIPYKQVATTPHSDVAYKNHPFGMLPTLIIHGIGNSDIYLCESQAIARYIDRVAPLPSLDLEPGEAGIAVPEKMWEFVSLAGSQGFPAVEIKVVKHRVQAIDDGKPSDAELREHIKHGVANLKLFLARMEALMAPEGYVYGWKVTWADFFLFPLLSDLKATPEGEILSPRMLKWLAIMEELKAVKDTTAGTLSVGGRP
ncbi:hypothetical protein DACRYDRAFT_23384 [Dacryopinax primogenitus]|uniref:GST N-terminal domain-containing protein n=1 Tax=Dacryopinax primogenitus (strain DJM 731) TaxID=1858805 RepID=M5FRL3_DACPD|nr:uncharacterized protein DACRYDRAFT_23384 [Dacryopinax primogenitus]EJT99805.1 hypothetical protein DACRYDRAFT_23384 [Dacryopinax primogenitus]